MKNSPVSLSITMEAACTIV